MYKSPIKKEIRKEILTRVKEGKDSVSVIAKQYGVSDVTIYNWLHQGIEG